METAPKFAAWQAVTLKYTDWDRETYPVECFVDSSRYVEKSEWSRPGYFYMLRIPNVYDLDKTDYQALEGENRDLYGWVAEAALSAREVPDSWCGSP